MQPAELSTSRSPTPADERAILDSWSPEPLVPELDYEDPRNQAILKPRIVTSKAGKYITIDGHEYLNFATHNYLGLADDKRLEEASMAAVRKYGVGSCGPRAFYGTMDVHLLLEEELAEFLNVQEACLYSYGFSTIASAIPAYAKSSDIVFVDEQCNFAIQQGLVASKSKILKFKHNNMRHLEQLIVEVRESHARGKPVRTFLIVEGLYAKTGDLCPLIELIELKKKYKIRLFIEESRSFGVLGSEGKGVTQHFNADPNDVDLIMASLENAMCAYGGFCAGSSYVVDHQRLSGTGYCFSASLPPFQCQVARESLRILREDPSIVRDAQVTYVYTHEVLSKLTRLENISDPLSPIKLLVIRGGSILADRDEANKNNKTSSLREEQLLDRICADVMAEERVALTVARYLDEGDFCPPLPSIRMIVSSSSDRSDIELVFRALERSSGLILLNENK